MVEVECGLSPFWDLKGQKGLMLSTLNFCGLKCREILLCKLLEFQVTLGNSIGGTLFFIALLVSNPFLVPLL